jgi:elongation factor G
VDIEITAPDNTVGDITGDLSSKRGVVTGTANGVAGTMIVRGQVPLAEVTGYQPRLNALTGGQGRYSVMLSHYDAVPPSVQTALVAAYKVQDEE